MTSALNAFQSTPSGSDAAVTVFEAMRAVGEELEAQRGEPGPRGGGARGVTGEDAPRDPRPP